MMPMVRASSSRHIHVIEYGNQLCQQVKITSKQVASIQEKQLEDKITETKMAELNRFLKNDKMAEKLSKLVINSAILKEM